MSSLNHVIGIAEGSIYIMLAHPCAGTVFVCVLFVAKAEL